MIRMIQESDIPEILDIYNWYIEHSTATFETELLSLDEFSERVHRICQKYPWLVLEDHDEIVGYAYLSAFNDRSAYDWTCDLAIYLKHTSVGHGYGSKLMDSICTLAKRDGYRKMVSLVTCGNQASEKLHEKFGFEKVGVLNRTGYKMNQWLGVSFYLKTLLESDNEPTTIQNLIWEE